MARRPVKKKPVDKPDKDGNYTLTERHRKIYEDAVIEFMHWFGLSEWKIWVVIEEYEGAYGFCRADCPSQSAVIGLTPRWDSMPTGKALRGVARHEVLELLLAPMWHAVLARSLDVDWAHSQRHTAIRRLENVLHTMV